MLVGDALLSRSLRICFFPAPAGVRKSPSIRSVLAAKNG